MGEYARVFGKTTRMVGGWTLSPINQLMKAEFESWLEQRALDRVEKMQNRMDPEKWQEYYDATMDSINGGGMSWGGRVCRAALRSADGTEKLIQLLMLPCHAGATEEDARDLITSHMKEIQEAVQYLGDRDPNSQTPVTDQPLPGAETA